MKRRGKIFVLSSPSGGGKTTICKKLKKNSFDVTFSISATTRSPRANEKDGADYIFLSKERFKDLRAKKRFLEWTNNFGDLYGTPKGFVDKAISGGKDIILAIDVKGAMQVKRLKKDAVLIFVLPPSLKMLKRRLRNRKTETKETVTRRLRIAKRELAYRKRYDYEIVNDNLAKAVAALKAIIIAERNSV